MLPRLILKESSYLCFFFFCLFTDMAQLLSVRLGRVDAQPWGLRLQGGADFGTPLVIQKVSLATGILIFFHTKCAQQDL